jgi:uncharacterized protein (TIGR03086 family)
LSLSGKISSIASGIQQKLRNTSKDSLTYDQGDSHVNGMASLEALNRVTAAAQDVVGRIGDDQLGLPTPCAEWDVRAILNHILHGDLLVMAWLRGQPWPNDGDVDYLGDDPKAAVLRGLSETIDEVRSGSIDRAVLTRMGDLPVSAPGGDGLIQRRVGDLFVHLWDLAVATGQPTNLDPELAEEVLNHYRIRIAEKPRETLKPAAVGPPPVAAEKPYPADATAADRLAAYMGRDVPVHKAKAVGVGVRDVQ